MVIVQGGADLIAIAAAVVIIIQTSLTRRALRESVDSRKVAEDALEVARAENQNSTFLALEAVRARIALNAPSAELHVDRVIDALFSPSQTGSDYLEPWPPGHVFHINDAGLHMTVRAAVSLRNTGARSTRFTLYGAIRTPVYEPNTQGIAEMVGTRPGPTDVLLGPGEALNGYWEVTRSMQEWISIYDARQSGDAGPEAVLEVHVDDGQDTGSRYIYGVVLGGAALRPEKAGLRETWVFAGLWDSASGRDTGMGSGTRPVKVLTWLSKSDEIRLPDAAPTLNPAAAQPEK